MLYYHTYLPPVPVFMFYKIIMHPSDVLVHRMLAQFEGFAAKVESQDANGVEAIK